MSKFEPGNNANPAGRPRASHSRRQLIDLIEESYPGYCPLVAIVAIAHADSTSPELKVRCHAEVAPYLRPKFRPAAPPVAFELPEGDLLVQMTAVLRCLSTGELPVDVASEVLAALGGVAKVKYGAELDARVKALEGGA